MLDMGERKHRPRAKPSQEQNPRKRTTNANEACCVTPERVKVERHGQSSAKQVVDKNERGGWDVEKSVRKERKGPGQGSLRWKLNGERRDGTPVDWERNFRPTRQRLSQFHPTDAN